MRAAPLLAALALALAIGQASAQSAMNYGYQVSGDPQARPIQAFDDGQKLYVQFRDVTSPPAPIGASGPLAYSIRGPYLVLPIVSSVQLRFGPYTAWVRADGAADVSPGVVSVTRPVEVPADALAPVAVRPPPPVAPPVAPSSAAGGRAVSGEIAASGPAGERRAVDAQAGRSAPAAVDYAAASSVNAFAGMRGQRVEIRADGTAAGARAAQAALRACRGIAARCSVTYSGAPNNKIMIVESN